MTIKLNTTTQIRSLMQCNYCRSDQFKFKPIVAPWCNFPFLKKIQSHLLSYCLHLFGAATVVGRLFTRVKRPRKSNVEVKITKRLDFRQLLCLFVFFYPRGNSLLQNPQFILKEKEKRSKAGRDIHFQYVLMAY